MSQGADRPGAASQRGEFSEPAIRRAVLQGTLSHPLSVYPVALSILGGLAIALFGPTAALIWGASGAVALGFSSWLVQYYARRKTFASAYLQRAHRRIEQQTRERLELLRTELHEYGLTRGAQQLAAFEAKIENLKELLARVFDPGELTYGRYLGIAEQVYLSAVDNLHEAALTLQAISTIDLAYVARRITELEKTRERREEIEPELESLRARKDLHAEQTDKVDELLARNEAALTQLDQTAAAVATIKTGPRSASVDFETAMSELERLASRAQSYSTR